MKPLWAMSIREVSARMQARKVSPLEVVEEAIARTHRYQKRLNPYITFLEEEAKAQGALLTKNMPKDLENRPLYGIPVGFKDLYCTRGILTTGASRLFSDYRPEEDATVVTRLKAAGAVNMGKHNLQELACGATGTASYYGPMRNPYDPAKICGGSSGGSAIAVATGMNYLAMGSDSGGSIRIPAAFCGVVGFKPSYGLVSLHGVMPLSPSLDHGGPLARSVLDAAIAMDAVTGFDPLDDSPRRYTGKPTAFAAALEKADRLDGVRVGVPENFFFDKTEEKTEKLVRKAISRLQELGARLIPVSFDFLEELPELSYVIALWEAARSYRTELEESGDRMSPFIQKRLQNGAAISDTDYEKATERRNGITRRWQEIMKTVDVVACPTVPIPAFPIEGDMQVTVRGKLEDGLTLCTRHTRLANLTGGPALSVPVGLAEGLPAALMLMGAWGDDETVLQVGHVYEKHFPFETPGF